MDGIQDSCYYAEASVCNASVSCVVALLGTLEDLSNGRGLSDEHIEILSKVKEPDNWQELYGKQVSYDDGGVSRATTLISGNLESGSDTETEEEEKRSNKPKHIRWQMDYEDMEDFSGMF